MKLKNKSSLLLALILLGALLLRAWGINFGLPHIQHIDERAIVYTSFYMAKELGKPNVFLHGTVFPTILAIFSGFYFLWGKMLGWFSTPEDFLASYLKDPTTIILMGRLLAVVFSLATVWLVYTVGRKLYNPRVGLLASLFLAVSALHVKESHYVKQDVLTGFFSLLLLYFAFSASRKGRLKDYVFGGVIFGLGFGTKYHFALTLPTVFLAHFLSERKAIRKILAFLASAILTFFMVSPYTFLDLKFFASEMAKWGARQMAYPWRQPHSPLWYFMLDYLKNGLGTGLWLMSFLGLTLSLYRFRKEQNLLVVSFPLVFFSTVNFWARNHVQRFALPALPYLVLLAACAIDRLMAKLSMASFSLGGAVSALILGGVIWQPLIRSIKFDYMITRAHTGVLSTAWIEKNIPPGSKIAVDGMLRPYYPSASGPYLYPTQESIRRELNKVPSNKKIGRYLRATQKATEGKVGYEIVATFNISFRYDPDLGEHKRLKDVGYYLEQDVEALVTNSWAQAGTPWTEEFADSVGRNYTLVVEFQPTVEFKSCPHVCYMDYKALDKVDIFDKNSIFGPKISIYQKR